jgi:hypothetical protein
VLLAPGSDKLIEAFVRSTPCDALYYLRGSTEMKSKMYVSAVAIVLLVSGCSNAPIEKGYRYWGYFQAAPGDSSWTPAMTGPTVNVKDGSVEGWAFTFSSDAMPDASAPKSAPSFEAICGTTPAVEGKKRIGLLVDFGPKSLQPDGESAPELVQECVVIDQAALGSDVLGQVTKINAGSSGLICGINGYPAKECGIEVEAPEEFRK